MQRLRITIAHIIVAVAICSVALAAIRGGSESWAGAMLSITFFVMIASLLGVALERGMWRIYWIGFATLGWSYLLLTFAPWVDQRIGAALLGPNLFEALAVVLHPDPQAGGGGIPTSPAPGGFGGGFRSVPVEMLAATGTGGGFGGGAWSPRVREFKRIGVSLEALLWAFAGGWVACYFATRRGRDDEAQAGRSAEGPQAGGQGPESAS